jgi:periplasmic protein TonB
MKLDLLKNQWLDIVFEGRNKLYGAYDLRASNGKTTMRSLIIGGVIFTFLVSIPVLANFLPNGDDDAVLDQKITTVKLPPKEKPKENVPPPPPPPPKVDQVKFVKPVVAKAEEVVEEPPKIKEIVDKKIGAETVKGDPDAELTVEPVGNGPKDVVEEDNNIYNSASIQTPADFPGGVDKFRSYIGKNFQTPDDDGFNGGKVFVSFVVEKDGSMTDIKVLRDAGYGTGTEAIRVIKSCKIKWNPGEQNGRKVRMLFTLPIGIQKQD